MDFADKSGNAPRRFFIGIGIGSYDDPALDLPKAEPDVVQVAEWFTKRSGVAHLRALEDLGKSPHASKVTESLRDFLQDLTPDDVVVIYMACHGELEGARAHLFGRNTPRKGLAGRSIEASSLGAILGQSAPHNFLLIIDACVAGRLGSAIQRAAEDASDELNNRDPHRPHALVVLASTYGRDPAHDGRFAEALLRVVSDERWTGTTSRWIDVGQLIRGLNEELKDIAPSQVAELRVSSTGVAELIPNPNLASRKLGNLIADEEFRAHFDPSARGVARGEAGTFFTGRVRELRRIVGWLSGHAADRAALGPIPVAADSLLVITGSPGSGKSALLSRAAIFSDPAHRPDDTTLAALAESTIPPADALDAVVWCHNKSERKIIEEIAAALGGSASTPDALLQLAADRTATIAIDALDESHEGVARRLASRLIKPLAEKTGIRLLVATRRRPVRDGVGGEADLLDHMGADPDLVIDLDESPETRADMRDYVEARIRATAPGDPPVAILADQIADAAGKSFLVAAIAARTAAAGKLTRRPDGTYLLPTEVGEALAGYIAALPNPDKARGLLRPLAWSPGAGLPWGTLWPRLATALARVAKTAEVTYDDDDVRALLDVAGDLVVESIESGQPVYRLFHEALAEHLRGETDEVRSHDALSHAMLELADGQPWRRVQRYVTAYLPVHLLGARRMDELVALLTDPTWDRYRREETGDPLAAVGVADATIERLLRDSATDLRVVPLCVVHSRAMTTAAPLVIDVIARSGQLARAEMMANNLAFAPDRMLAFRYMFSAYSRERDLSAARRCLEEVRRSLPAMPQTHQPMAWYWVAKAEVDAGHTQNARNAAEAALDAARAIEDDGWDLPNGYFWAALASRLTKWEAGTQRIREMLDALEAAPRRNQLLQAASAAGHRTLLEQSLADYLRGRRFPRGMIRDGNIALALADAGMEAEAARVFDLVGDGVPEGQPDSNKRWVWALALSNRVEQAIQALAYVHDPIEKGKAVARIAALASKREDKHTLKLLVPLVEPLLDGVEPRSQARLIHVLWLAGERAQSLALAEKEIATGHATRVMADPRDGVGPVEVKEVQGKTGKREMVSSVVPVSDEQWGREAEYEIGRGNLAKANELLEKIAVPLIRARTLAAFAKHDPDPENAVASWLRAMAEARRAGRGVVDEHLPVGIEVLNRAGRSEEAKTLNSQIEAVNIRWDIESFSEQYEALRKSMLPGFDRTRRLTALMLVPRRLAQTHHWTRDNVRAVWRANEDGKRLFVLGLMQADPRLADPRIFVDGIRQSRSTFEQHNALLAAAQANLVGKEDQAVRAAVEAEVRGDPRPDGTKYGIPADSERMALAQRLLQGEGV